MGASDTYLGGQVQNLTLEEKTHKINKDFARLLNIKLGNMGGVRF